MGNTLSPLCWFVRQRVEDLIVILSMDRGANTRIVSLVLPRLHTFCVTFCTTPCAHVHGTDGVNVSHHGKQKVDGFLFVRVKSVYKNFSILSPLFLQGVWEPPASKMEKEIGMSVKTSPTSFKTSPTSFSFLYAVLLFGIAVSVGILHQAVIQNLRLHVKGYKADFEWSQSRLEHASRER